MKQKHRTEIPLDNSLGLDVHKKFTGSTMPYVP